MICTKARTILQPHIGANEKLLWAQNGRGFRLDGNTVYKLIFMPIWMSIFIAGIEPALTDGMRIRGTNETISPVGSLIFLSFFITIGIIGLYIVIRQLTSPLFSTYGITDKKVYIIHQKFWPTKTTILTPTEIQNLHAQFSLSGGNVWLNDLPRQKNLQTHGIVLRGIKDAELVAKIIHDELGVSYAPSGHQES